MFTVIRSQSTEADRWFCCECGRFGLNRTRLHCACFHINQASVYTRYCSADQFRINPIEGSSWYQDFAWCHCCSGPVGLERGVQLRISHRSKFNYFEFNPRNVRLSPRVCRDQSQSQTLIARVSENRKSGRGLRQIEGCLMGSYVRP
jgi:hypothetical protein